MMNSLIAFIFVIIGARAQYGPQGGPPGGWAQSEAWRPPINWGPQPGTYDETWVITPPNAPGPVLIPGIEDLGGCKDTINWCLTDIAAKGLIAFYYGIVDNCANLSGTISSGNDVCYLLQTLFNSCLGDINCRTCTIFTLENNPSDSPICNVYNSTGQDITGQIINIHYGNNMTNAILPFINPTNVRALITATNQWCPT